MSLLIGRCTMGNDKINSKCPWFSDSHSNLISLNMLMLFHSMLDFMIKTNDKQLLCFDLPEVIFKCELQCTCKLA